MYQLLLIIFSLISIPLSLYSENSECMQCTYLNFETAWLRTINYNPIVDIAETEIDMRQADKTQASLPINPVVSIEVENVLGSGPFQEWDLAETTYSVFQTFELGGKRHARKRFASSQVEIAFWESQIAMQDLRYELKIAFINTYIAQEKLHLAKGRHEIAEKTLEIVETQVKAGKVSPIQTKKALIALKSEQVSLVEAQSQLIQAKESLALMWGQACPDFDCVDFEFFVFSCPKELCEIVPGLFKTPDYIRSESEITAASKNLKIQLANRIPDVTLKAGYRTYNDLDDHAFVFEALMPIPIFNKNQGNVRRARLEVSQSQSKLAEEVLTLKEKITSSYEELLASFDKASVIRDQILTEAEEALLLTEEGFQKGKFHYLDLLDAQRTLFEIQQQYIDILTTYHLSRVEIERLSGEYNCIGKNEI